jgi:hypothetical protein
VQLPEPELRPLLPRSVSNYDNREPVFSCVSDPHSHLPVYTNIHRIRRDIISVVEDYLSIDQLRDVYINLSVVRPLVDKFYDLDDISISKPRLTIPGLPVQVLPSPVPNSSTVYCLLVNRAQFLEEQSHLSSRENVDFTRATLCELVASRVLRRIGEDNDGPEGLLVLAHVLLAAFEPFQNAPPEVRDEVQASMVPWNGAVPALEVAILSESKAFLSSTPCQKV